MGVPSSFADLPPEIVEKIAAYLGLRDTWRSVDEVVRDHAALAMTSRCVRPLASLLADQLADAVHGDARRGVVAVPRPVVPDSLDHVDVSETSSMADLRAAARKCGIKCARSRAALYRAVRAELDARPAAVMYQAERRDAFDSQEPPPPVPENPVPVKYRRRVLEPQCMSAKGAKARFALTDTDLAALPEILKPNPYFSSAAPMRLFRVRDLRDVARQKHNDPAGVERAKRARSERASRARDSAESVREVRRAKLEAALEERGCELRADSKLCDAYIGTGRGDVQVIADVMAEMKFVHEHTRYAQILHDNIEEMREMGERYDVNAESFFARRAAIEEFVAAGVDMHLLPLHLR